MPVTLCLPCWATTGHVAKWQGTYTMIRNYSRDRDKYKHLRSFLRSLVRVACRGCGVTTGAASSQLQCCDPIMMPNMVGVYTHKTAAMGVRWAGPPVWEVGDLPGSEKRGRRPGSLPPRLRGEIQGVAQRATGKKILGKLSSLVYRRHHHHHHHHDIFHSFLT